jgi:endonuclease/exonuclease/phosphatase (EEP) superfamily protein YafD
LECKQVPILLHAIRRLVLTCATLYGSVVVVLSLLWAAGPQHVWWVALSNIFAPYAFLPLLVLVPAAMLLRSRWLTGWLAVLLLLFGVLFGSQLLPRAPQREAATLRVVTFNQLFNNKRTADVIAAIRAQNADVVALQELSDSVAAAAQQQLHDEYPYQLLQPADQPSGLGLLSRYPFDVHPVAPDARYQKVVLHAGGTAITVLNVHPHVPRVQFRESHITRPWQQGGYDTSTRTQELDGVLNEMYQTAGAILVVGDFNLSDREPMYQLFSARMHDAFRETNWGFGFTFPNHGHFGPVELPFPLVRIDYVWSAGGILPVATNVNGNDVGSDHCMLVADMTLRS